MICTKWKSKTIRKCLVKAQRKEYQGYSKGELLQKALLVNHIQSNGKKGPKESNKEVIKYFRTPHSSFLPHPPSWMLRISRVQIPDLGWGRGETGNAFNGKLLTLR